MNSTENTSARKAIIVDDEKYVRSALREILMRQSTLVEVVAEAANIPEAVREIHKHQPDLIFLDIDMPGYTGLQILEFFNPQEVTFDIIFVTAYNEYALQAFKMSAFDYLLKPVNEPELQHTLERYLRRGQQAVARQVAMLREAYTQGELPRQLAVISLHGTEFIELTQLEVLEASGTYTTLVLDSGEKIVSSKPLGEFEELLRAHPQFFRTHRSFMVNLRQVKKLLTREGDIIHMKGGMEVPLSRYRKKEFDASLPAYRI